MEYTVAMNNVDHTSERAWQVLQAGNVHLAEQICRQILASAPDDADAWHVLGIALRRRDLFDEAAAALRRAVTLSPSFARAHNNLGGVYQAQGKLSEAAESYRHAIAAQPDFSSAYNNLGLVLSDLGSLDEAVMMLRKALQIKPDYAAAWNNLGLVLRNQGDMNQAVMSFERALALRPDMLEALANLGGVLHQMGRLEEAVGVYRRAIQAAPQIAPLHANLGVALLDLGQIAAAQSAFRESLRLHPDPTAHSGLLQAMNYDPDIDPIALRDEHFRWAGLYGRSTQPLALSNPASSAGMPALNRFRIGYVSPDFRAHIVSCFIEPVLQHHDRQAFEVFLYSEAAGPDAVSDRMRGLADQWRATNRMSDDELARRIAADEIDLLIDLAGHTSGNRLRVFAQRPAAVQATWLGYPNTTGLAAIDYRITDGTADPVGEPSVHSEKPIRLEPSFCCYQPPAVAEVSQLPALEAGRITFGSLHKLTKLNSQVLDLWARLLRSLPDARLFLFRNTLGPWAQQYFRAEFARRGIDRDRVDMSCELPPNRSHFDLYRRIDIMLDVFPWSGHATACEALWMGVPVVTLRGSRHAGRMVASLLQTVGRPAWIANTQEEYLNIARNLASNLDELATTRARLREQVAGSPLCDGARFTRQLEAAYRTMCQAR